MNKINAPKPTEMGEEIRHWWVMAKYASYSILLIWVSDFLGKSQNLGRGAAEILPGLSKGRKKSCPLWWGVEEIQPPPWPVVQNCLTHSGILVKITKNVFKRILSEVHKRWRKIESPPPDLGSKKIQPFPLRRVKKSRPSLRRGKNPAPPPMLILELPLSCKIVPVMNCLWIYCWLEAEQICSS